MPLEAKSSISVAEWLPRTNGLRTVLGDIRDLSDQLSDLNASFGLIDESSFSFASTARGRKCILPPAVASIIQNRLRRVKPLKVPPIQDLLKRAYLLKTRLTDESGITRSELARRLGLDPSRVTQILNLLNLTPEIQKYIEGLQPTKHRSPVGDDDWMRLARLRNPIQQNREFQKLFP